jgi:hypothetical protein
MSAPLAVGLALALTQAPFGFELIWNVPCAPRPSVTELGGTQPGAAVVTVVQAGAGWRLEVAFSAPVQGVRTLHAARCEDAAQAAVLFLKLGARAEREEAPPPPPPPPEAPAAPAPAAPTTALAAAPPAPSGDDAQHLRLEVSGLGSTGALPALSARGAVGLGLERGAFTAVLALRAGAPALFDAASPPEAQFSVHPTLGAQLSACFLPTLGRIQVGACGVAALEWWRVEGRNVAAPRSSSAVWLALGADARLTVRLAAGLYAVATLGARFALRRPQVTFDTFVAYAAPVVGAEGSVGAGWRW